MEIVGRGFSIYTSYGDEIAIEDNFERAFLMSQKNPKTGEMIKLSLEKVEEFLAEGEEFGFLLKKKGDGVWTGFTFFKLMEKEPDGNFYGWENGANVVPENTCGYCVSFHQFKSSTDGQRICAKGKDVNHLSVCCSDYVKILMIQCPKLTHSGGWTNLFVCQSRRGFFGEIEKFPADKTCVECTSFTGDKRMMKF